MVANGPAKHWIPGLKRIQHGALRDWPGNFNFNFARSEARQYPQMRRKNNANHGSVCTSTDSTAGRSRTIGAQFSPASADAYTWPPVVPK